MQRPKTVDDLPLIFGIDELATIMDVSRNKAYQLVKSKGFPVTRIGHKHIISKDYFLKWLEKSFNKTEE